MSHKELNDRTWLDQATYACMGQKILWKPYQKKSNIFSFNLFYSHVLCFFASSRRMQEGILYFSLLFLFSVIDDTRNK